MIAPLPGNGLRILLVDDYAPSAAGMRRLLCALGHDVRVARDGEEALRRAEEFKPDAAIVDLSLPRLDGYGVAEAMRTMGATRNALLVALTGWTGDDIADRVRAAGFDQHLTKPVTADTLIGALATQHAP
jgi:CheY-like chemotaxis protein